MPGRGSSSAGLLPARLMVYFVLALWLFRGRNCGYGQVMTKLADGLYHQRRAGDLLAGQQLDPGWVDAGQGRRWRSPNISSLSRGRGKLGPAPVRFLFEQVAGPIGDEGMPGVFCCGLRVVSIDGSVSDVPDSEVNDEHFGRPSTRPGTGRSRRSGGWRRRSPGPGACSGHPWPYRDSEQALARDLLESGCSARAGAGGPQVPVLGAGAGVPGHRGAHLVARIGVFHPQAGESPGGRHSSGGQLPLAIDGPPLMVRVIEYTVHTAPEDGGDEATSELFCRSPTCWSGRSMPRVGWPGGISPPGSHRNPGVTLSRHRALLTLPASAL